MDIFVARQPIFDAQQRVIAYELLFRSSLENVFSHHDPDQATLTVIDHSLFNFGFDNLIGNKKAFINLTRKVLLEDLASILPAERVVLEILETINPDQDVVAACRLLKETGYVMALDDFVAFDPAMEPLLGVADIVKVDFMGTNAEKRQELAQIFAQYPNLQLLAEKVETQQDFREGVDLGYEYFQGYFFCKPQVLTGRKIPAYKLNYLRFMKSINRPEINLKEVEEIVRQEVSLSVRLLRYLNSAALGLRSKVTSIHHGLVLLGEKPLRKWAHMVTVAGLGDDKPGELVLTCLLRARFCELLAPVCQLKNRENDLFLVGLLSAVDAIMDQPKSEILKEMAVSEDIQAALLGQSSPFGNIYQIALAYERGDWESLGLLLSNVRVPEERIPELYAQAVEWAQQATQIMQN